MFNIGKIVLLLSILTVYSLGSTGSATYEIKEQDLISEIENKAPEIEKKMEEQKKIILEKKGDEI